MTPPTTQTVYSFGTSGYRNDTDEGFNEAVVRQITGAVADYLVSESDKAGQALPILIGGDTREKTRRFIPVITDMLRDKGFDVFQADSDVPSPVLAYAAKYFAELGDDLTQGQAQTLGAILMTASHNPWAYGGYNFLTPDAAVAPSHVSKQFESNQKVPQNKKLDRQGSVHKFDPYFIYQKHLKDRLQIDYEAIKKSGVEIYYDALYATGRNYFPRLLKDEGIDVTMIHGTEERPAGYTGMPEPTGSNLSELSELVKKSSASNRIGFSNDGDSDRFGVLDENGEYIISNDILALTLYHLIKNKNQQGVVVRSQATTHLLDAIAGHHGLPVQQTPVGYKYIAEEFIERYGHDYEVLIGGESSGGLSVLGHIPEKDGILANLLIAELVADEGKPVGEILKELKASVPEKFAFHELSITTEAKDKILAHYQNMVQTGGALDGFKIDSVKSRDSVKALEEKYHTKDGAKLYLEDGSWVLIRACGTEPLVRVYIETVAEIEADAVAKAARLRDAVMAALMGEFNVPEEQIKQKV